MNDDDEFRAVLEEVIAEAPEQERLVLRLAFEDKNNPCDAVEIAKVIDLPLTDINRIMRSGIGSLRRKLADRGWTTERLLANRGITVQP